MKISASKQLIVAVTCGAALLLSACNEDVTPTKGATGSTASTSAAAGAPTTAKAEGGSATGNTPTEAGGNGGGSAAGNTPTEAGGNAPTTKKAAPVSDEPWDPCAIMDPNVSAAGLNTSTKKRRTENLNYPLENSCQWLTNDGRFEVIIESLGRKWGDLKPGSYENLRRIKIDGRNVMIFNAAQDGNHIGCIISTEVSYGTVDYVLRSHDLKPAPDACDVGQAIAVKFSKNLRD
ncbi:DUF3558 domain-containing protein [Nocardia panacis]|uniref:DUF3558 domain-containing protein n=1 Tax=Nocardia panacis TaxID=2340916 RepID=A0A3A4KQF4_9NOCA|nr:DUF3558 family protein [Nocardia panacis]RJO76802.1 DUF3558 domain-containing protein [Nocardia panacis]